MTVYGYIRVSTKHQIDNTSFATQRKTIRGLAMTHDCDDEEIVWLEDPAVSAAKNFFSRPATAPVVFVNGDTIIAASQDRFSRNLLDSLSTIDELKKRKVRLIIKDYGDVTDQKNAFGRLMVNTMANFAEFEREKIIERVRTTQAHLKASGLYTGGKVPWGCQVSIDENGNKILDEYLTKYHLPDANLKKRSPRWFIIHRMAGLRKRGMSSRAVVKWVKKRYRRLPKISHTTVTKLTDEHEGKPISQLPGAISPRPYSVCKERLALSA